jgi:hypothetical protein
MALKLHRATWPPAVTVLAASGPLTLVSSRDTRRYRLAGDLPATAVVTGVWEQLTMREVTLPVDLSAARRPAPGQAAEPGATVA